MHDELALKLNPRRRLTSRSRVPRQGRNRGYHRQPEQESVHRRRLLKRSKLTPQWKTVEDSGHQVGRPDPLPYQSSTRKPGAHGSESYTSDQVAADQGLLPLEDGADWEGAAEEPVASQFSSGTAVSDLSVTSDSGFTYTLVPDLQNRQQAVFEIRAESPASGVEITNKERLCTVRFCTVMIV